MQSAVLECRWMMGAHDGKDDSMDTLPEGRARRVRLNELKDGCVTSARHT